MSESKKQRIEFGDFQTPDDLAIEVCQRLARIGISPAAVIEPTCGRGAFLAAAGRAFPIARQILGFDINPSYLGAVEGRMQASDPRVRVECADFFATNWREKLAQIDGTALVIGNFPWVTNAVQGSIGGANLPEKSNFQKHNGFDAISGKANFDISEWMLLEVMRWFEGRAGDVAMLVKTAVARKILAHAERQAVALREASIIGIDAKKSFGVSVEACLLVMRFSADRAEARYDYTVFPSLDDGPGKRVGHRMGLVVGDLEKFDATSFLVGTSPQKWRSGIKHDATAVMEFTRKPHGLENGFGDLVDLEFTYLYPLLKGSDIGSAKSWRNKYVLVTQNHVGAETDTIERVAPKTWDYLSKHSAQLDARGSTIYSKNPRFSIFGIGDYAFKPWKIAVCGLYKSLRFRVVGPIEDRPVMFDDTVYYLSFDSEEEARATLDLIESEPARQLLTSLIFWDEKRPIKTGILNVLDWSKLMTVPSLPSCEQVSQSAVFLGAAPAYSPAAD